MPLVSTTGAIAASSRGHIRDNLTGPRLRAVTGMATASGTISTAIPASTQPGDLLILWRWRLSDFDSIPTGWTRYTASATLAQASYRVAVEGDAGTLVTVGSGPGTGAVAIMAITNPAGAVTPSGPVFFGSGSGVATGPTPTGYVGLEPMRIDLAVGQSGNQSALVLSKPGGVSAFSHATVGAPGVHIRGVISAATTAADTAPASASTSDPTAAIDIACLTIPSL